MRCNCGALHTAPMPEHRLSAPTTGLHTQPQTPTRIHSLAQPPRNAAMALPSKPLDVRNAVMRPPGDSTTLKNSRTQVREEGRMGCAKYERQPSRACAACCCRRASSGARRAAASAACTRLWGWSVERIEAGEPGPAPVHGWVVHLLHRCLLLSHTLRTSALNATAALILHPRSCIAAHLRRVFSTKLRQLGSGAQAAPGSCRPCSMAEGARCAMRLMKKSCRGAASADRTAGGEVRRGRGETGNGGKARMAGGFLSLRSTLCLALRNT